MNKFTTTLFLMLTGFSMLASAGTGDPYNRTYIQNNKEQISYQRQRELQQDKSWLQFTTKHQGWKVVFDERNSMPHRAYSAGIKLA